jgi:hypothetical protein
MVTQIFQLVFAVVMGLAFGTWLTLKIYAGNRKQTSFERAQEIAIVADRITDKYVLAMPNARWDDILEKVAKIIVVELGVSEKIATREAIHQLRVRGRLV